LFIPSKKIFHQEMQLGDSERFFFTQLKFLKELGGEELALVTLKKFRWNKQEKS